MTRKLSLIEPLAVFAAIMAYIWLIRFAHPWFVVPILPAVLFSHFARNERARSLGFRITQLRECIRRFGPALVALVLLMLVGGRLLGTIRPIGLNRAALGLALYLPWGLFQQYLLNGYFLKRFDTALPPRASDATAAALFSVVHCPNWFLMLLTPLAGYASIQIYRRHRNLYFLGVAHAMIGFLLFMVLPDTVIHHLNVGPAR
ncbi:MAG TPA: CPBP family glutamic-type intramembrane protease [Bryobacteraceae bacterium]|nr:CPBP family glutamic-type intramembrane protease [Bryobacteraceae bacterium]